ncbi:MAG: SipW-dependent-type signal peptide-containing protein [Dethiobacteria bacterium]
MKKVKYIALILVLALGLIGGAYAAWTDVLNVAGTVATGDIDVVFTEALSNDAGNTGDPGQPEGKDVASTEVEVIEGGKALKVTIDNAYPGYVSRVDYKVTNNGSVPVKLQDKTVTYAGPASEAALEVENGCLKCWLEDLIENSDLGFISKNLLLRVINDLFECTCDEEPGPLDIGSQIHFGDVYEGSIGHVVTEAAKQGQTYSYTIKYDFVQWNLYEEPTEQ